MYERSGARPCAPSSPGRGPTRRRRRDGASSAVEKRMSDQAYSRVSRPRSANSCGLETRSPISSKSVTFTSRTKLRPGAGYAVSGCFDKTSIAVVGQVNLGEPVATSAPPRPLSHELYRTRPGFGPSAVHSLSVRIGRSISLVRACRAVGRKAVLSSRGGSRTFTSPRRSISFDPDHHFDLSFAAVPLRGHARSLSQDLGPFAARVSDGALWYTGAGGRCHGHLTTACRMHQGGPANRPWR